MNPISRWAEIRYLEWYLMDKYDVYTSFEKEGTDEYWFDPDNFEEDKGMISIDSSKAAEHQLYVLLHEAGHVALRHNIEKFSERFPGSCRGTLHGRLEILKEEVLAWDIATDIAAALRIKIEKEEWRKNYRDALEKYTRWVLAGDENE